MELHKPVQIERKPREEQAPQHLWTQSRMSSSQYGHTEDWGGGKLASQGVVQGQESCELVGPGGLYHTLNHWRWLTMLQNSLHCGWKKKGFGTLNFRVKLHQLAGKFICVEHSIKTLSSKGMVPLLAVFFTLINYCLHIIPVGRCFPKPISGV